MNYSGFYDVIVIGAGPAGLVCAAEAGKRGRKVLVLEKSDQPGRRLLVTGGGRCNFTNLNLSSDNYLSQTPKFSKSALSRFGPADFIHWVQQAGISYEQREHQQLFCKSKARSILEMLLQRCLQGRVDFRFNCSVQQVNPNWQVTTAAAETVSAAAIVVATGGLARPQLGVSDSGFNIARSAGLKIIKPAPALTPLILSTEDQQKFSCLAGISAKAAVRLISRRHRSPTIEFVDDLLFTHQGLSGPVILQISSYFQPGDEIQINFLNSPNQPLPRRLVKLLPPLSSVLNPGLSGLRLKPAKAAGWSKAEVMAGGVSCRAICPRSFQVRKLPGLYFIGEILDVTGQLGGYNLQWAWSSGWCAGQTV